MVVPEPSAGLELIEREVPEPGPRIGASTDSEDTLAFSARMVLHAGS
jgi:hypothetical protein